MEDSTKQVIEAWRTNQRINTFLIKNISAEGMRDTLSVRGGRNVTRQFCHLHNVRLWQLEARAKDLAKGLYKFATKEEPPKRTLKKHLNESARRIELFFSDCAAGKPKRRAFKKGLIPFLGYLIAHESHHRGNILLTIKQCGHNLKQAERYGIWDWDRI